MTSSTLRSSLSLPEIKMVERRVIAYKQGWDKRVEHVEKGLQMEEHLARRRLRDSAISTRKEHKSLGRVNRARQLLGTPLSAGITPFEMEKYATGLREAQREMQADCVRREQMARRAREAKRELTVAADHAEALKALRAEELFRVRSKQKQEEEWHKHRHELEKQRRTREDWAAELEERHAEKAHRESLRQQRASALAEGVAARRAKKDADEKREREEKYKADKEREARAAAKAQLKADRKAYVDREAALDYSKRLEKVWKYATNIEARAEEDLEAHVLLCLGEGESAGLSRRKLLEAAAKMLEQGAEADGLSETDDGEGGGGGYRETHARAELRRLKSKLELARKRQEAARETYDKAVIAAMTEEEKAEYLMDR